MKSLTKFSVVLFTIMGYALCMDADPAKIIRIHIESPSEAMCQLSRIPEEGIADYRDFENNNLLHIVVKELMAKQSSPKYDQLQQQAGDLIFYLKERGVDINAFNNSSETPILLTRGGDRPQTHDRLFNALRRHGANPTHFSVVHEGRMFFRWLTQHCCCRSKLD